MEVRCLMSAKDASTAFDLQCYGARRDDGLGAGELSGGVCNGADNSGGGRRRRRRRSVPAVSGAQSQAESERIRCVDEKQRSSRSSFWCRRRGRGGQHVVDHLRQHALRPVGVVLLHGVFGGAAGVAVRHAGAVLECARRSAGCVWPRAACRRRWTALFRK